MTGGIQEGTRFEISGFALTVKQTICIQDFPCIICYSIVGIEIIYFTRVRRLHASQHFLNFHP